MKFKFDEDLPAYVVYTDGNDYLGLIIYNTFTEDCEYAAYEEYSYSRNDMFSISDKIASLRRIRGSKGMD